MEKKRFGKLLWKSHVIDLSKVKSTDPLAYAYGFMQGQSRVKLPKSKRHLAPEYIRGWKDGHKKIKKVI
jgi:hypothetical protein